MKQKTLALPIFRVNYSDSSQVVELFTRDYGIVRGLAKGAHREGRNPFQGPFDLGTLVEVVFIGREGLSILTEKVVLEDFTGLRRSYRAHLAGLSVIEYLRVAGREGDPLVDLFRLAADCLREISGGMDPGTALVLFAIQAVRILGWFPELERCVRCGRAPARGGRVYFDPAGGGAVCSGCAGPGDHRAAPGALRIIGSLGRTWPPPWGRVVIPRELFSDILRVLSGSTVFQLEREPKMLQYLGNQL